MSTRRFKPGFIDEETDYTRGNVVPGAAPVRVEPETSEERSSSATIEEARPAAPRAVTKRARDASPALSKKTSSSVAIAREGEPIVCRCIVRFALDAETTTRLDAVAREVGQDAAVILGQLRKSVVLRLHEVLAAEQRPTGDTPHGSDGAKVRVNFTLAGEEYVRAKAWFDPLGIGDHAMRENMIPTLAQLYRDRIRELGRT